MKFSSHFLPAIALATGLALAPMVSAEDNANPTADTVLAKIGDQEITLGHMIALRAGLPEQYAQIPAELIFPGMLDQLIRHAVLAEAHEGDLNRLSQIRLQNETRALAAEEMAEDIAAGAVSDEAIAAFYEKEVTNAEPQPEYHAAHILVETEEAAKELVTELENGADFAELAKEKSTGPSGPNGGDLGWFGEGMMVEPFFDATAQLEPGKISGPVKTDFGWHVIKLIETRDQEKPSLDEMRDVIISQIEQNAVNDFVAEKEGEISVDRTDLEGFNFNALDDTKLLEN